MATMTTEQRLKYTIEDLNEALDEAIYTLERIATGEAMYPRGESEEILTKIKLILNKEVV